MAKFDKATVQVWKAKFEKTCAKHGMTLDDVVGMAGAWNIFRHSDMWDVYDDRTVTDAHIETAFKKIFPNLR